MRWVLIARNVPNLSSNLFSSFFLRTIGSLNNSGNVSKTAAAFLPDFGKKTAGFGFGVVLPGYGEGDGDGGVKPPAGFPGLSGLNGEPCG